MSANHRRELSHAVRRQRTSSTMPIRIRINPNPIQRQELLKRLVLALLPAGSAGTGVCSVVETDGSGALVFSSVGRGVVVGIGVGDAVVVAGLATGVASVVSVAKAVAVVRLAVGEVVAEGSTGTGVWLPVVGKGVGEREAVAVLVAVAALDVGSLDGVADGLERVGDGVSEGVPGGFVGVRVGVCTVDSVAVGVLVVPVAVGVLVAPVGVIVGMV